MYEEVIHLHFKCGFWLCNAPYPSCIKHKKSFKMRVLSPSSFDFPLASFVKVSIAAAVSDASKKKSDKTISLHCLPNRNVSINYRTVASNVPTAIVTRLSSLAKKKQFQWVAPSIGYAKLRFEKTYRLHPLFNQLCFNLI